MFQQMGIDGQIIGISIKFMIEIVIEIVYICKTCDTKYLRFPSFKNLFGNFFSNSWFVLTFCVAISIEFSLFEAISIYLYRSKNKEVNIGIWSACDQLIIMSKIN